MKFRKLFWKTWNFLIHEDSLASFAADAIIIILIGKFLLFPGLGMVLGSDFPVVAVVSNSMNHQQVSIDDWWKQNSDLYSKYNISKSQFEQFYLEDGFKQGDVLVIRGVPADELEVGDIIVYSTQVRKDPIIHRVVSLDPIATKGDSNSGQISFERDISTEQIHGKAVFLVPYIGWVKVGFLKIFGLL